VALPLPEDVRAALVERIDRLRAASDERVRWVTAENLHVTLLFIGDRDPVEVPALVTALANVAAARRPYRIELSGAGSFHGDRRGRVLWIGVAAGRAETVELAGALAREITPAEGEREGAVESVPHITVARGASGSLAEEARRLLANGSSLAWRADRIHLYHSQLGRGAPVYDELAALPLGRHASRLRSPT
jgi:RNA 2',3'-cyclic 3'-phosphodiesterase